MSTFDNGYKKQLLETYPEAIVSQITDEPLRAELPLQVGETLPYVHVKPELSKSNKAIMFVPGFSEGIINKASFAAELALQGAEIILPGQNRKSILRDATNKKSATHTQACNYLAVLEAVKPDQPIDVVTHSYGSLIFDAMVRLAPERFTESNVVMLAPAGSIENETLVRLGKRWIAMMRSEMTKKRPMEFPDYKGVTGKASAKTLLANIPRMVREVGDLTKNNVDYTGITKVVGSLSVLSYAEDKMFPENTMAPMLTAAVNDGVRWATPVSLARVVTGEMNYGGHGAVHDDEQYNPSRVASAILDILR